MLFFLPTIQIKMFVFNLYILISFSGVLAYDCFKNKNEFSCKFGVLTPYRYIANLNDSSLNYPGCKEKKIWLMIRHGTRFPKKKTIKSMMRYLPEMQKKIIENFETKQLNLSADLIKKIASWKLSFNVSDSMNLAEEGENELIDLAERMQARFPMLFLEDYDKELYKFKYTATQRTETSAKSFALGLFGQYYSTNISFLKAEYKDPILRFYKKCPRWQINIKDNPEAYKEKSLFLQNKILQNVLLSISRRVGFNLDYESVDLIYKICGFENAWNRFSKSPWCNLLSLDDVEVLEYLKDLEKYWTDGYGFRLNYEQACPALLDMFSFFESSDKSIVTAYFTHSGTILKMLSILGIKKDENPLMHNSYELHKNSRKWKIGLTDAFASNMAFVLYDCKSQGLSVIFLHQERPVNIPGCPDKMPCPISIIKDKFPDTEKECQFDTMCSI